MKKRIISTLLCITMLATTLTGCGAKAETPAPEKTEAKTETEEKEVASTESTGEKTKVRMTYWNNEDTVKALLDYLAVTVPDVEVEFQFIENSNYDTIVDTQLSAGEGPDIICENPASTLKHAQLGYLEDMSQLATNFSDAGNNVYSYDGKVYALPGISWFEGIYFNKAIFEENKIELPKTFDEYIAVCKQFQDMGIKPLAAGLKSWEPMLKNSMAFITADYLSQAEGKNFASDYRDGTVSLDGTWNTYVEKWSEMIKQGIYTTDMTGIDHPQALEEFAAGKAAMFCSGPWDLEAIMAKNPELKLDMMPFYGTKESAGWLIGGPGNGFAVNAASKNKDAAMKVLTAIATMEGQAALWENSQGGSSYFKGASFELPEAFTSAKTAIEAGNVYCPWNEWGKAGAAHADYGTQMQSYLLGEQDIAETLANVDVIVKELLEK